MKNALNNQVGMLGDMFLWHVANLKQGVIYFIKQALPQNISAGSVNTYKIFCRMYGLVVILTIPTSNLQPSIQIFVCIDEVF